MSEDELDVKPTESVPRSCGRIAQCVVTAAQLIAATAEALAVRLQTVIQFDLENLEVENITTWRFNPLEFEDPGTAPFVCAKLLTSCIPLSLKHAGVSDMEISAFAETVQAGYSKSVPHPGRAWLPGIAHHGLLHVILYALLMCAAAHDIGHPGLSNELPGCTHYDTFCTAP
eukprot:Skav205316  [mRNA]  locus=scaffold3444:189065:193165:+ [translate_table: standard]